MKRIERIRKAQFDSNEAMQLMQEGWRLTSVEWEREVDAPGAIDPAPSEGQFEELPYGLRVAQDCHHVEQDPHEMQALNTLTELIVQDATLTRMADELNRRGFKPRQAAKWNALMIYNLLPRLIEVTPRIFAEDQWKSRRPQIAAIAWNS